MKRPILSLLALHLALLPCFADVIPSRRAEKNTAAEQVVKARLEQLGMTATDADRHVQELTPSEVAYFGQNPNRVQVVGGLDWYEWVGGAAVLTTVVLFWILWPVRLK